VLGPVVTAAAVDDVILLAIVEDEFCGESDDEPIEGDRDESL
jgi:hypothetical protein